MNEPYRSEEFDELTPPLDAALQALLSEPLATDAVERVMLRARQLASAPQVTPAKPQSQPRPRQRSFSKSLLGLALAAAAVVAVMFGLNSAFDRTQGQAFAQVVSNMNAAESIQFSLVTQFGKQPAQTSRMLMQRHRLRIEHFDGKLVCIGDFDRKQALFLDVVRKLAQSTAIDAKTAEQFANPIDQLRHLTDKDVVSIGEEDLNGRRVKVFRLRKAELLGMTGAAEVTVWSDAATKLPVKIQVRDDDPKAYLTVRYEGFQWNQSLSESLFSIEVPGGYNQGMFVLSPRKSKAGESQPVSAEPNAAFVQGVLSDDRVPAHLVWNPQGTTITAMLRDPESTAPQDFQPHELRQWDIATGKLLWSEKVAGAGWVAGTTDGKVLANVIGYEVQLRDATTGKIARTWTAEKQLSPLAFDPQGAKLAAGIAEWGPGGKELAGGVQIWNVADGKLVRTIQDDKPTTFVKFSVDGKYLASSSNSGPIKLWDASSGELVRIFPGSSRADFSSDGKWIACPASDSKSDENIGTIRIFNLQTGDLVRSLTSDKAGSASYVLSVDFSVDGKLLAAADWNGTATVWNAETGERRSTISNHKAGVLAAEFNPLGSVLATGSEDKTLRLQKLQ